MTTTHLVDRFLPLLPVCQWAYCSELPVSRMSGVHLPLSPSWEGGAAFARRGGIDTIPWDGIEMASDLSFGEYGVDQIEDADWLNELVRITTRELPAPSPRKRKKGLMRMAGPMGGSYSCLRVNIRRRCRMFFKRSISRTARLPWREGPQI